MTATNASAPSVSFAIQAHPRRRELAEALAERIGGEVEIVWDPEPEGVPSPWRTFRHLIETKPASATHRVQIQDDAVVCDGFRDAVLAAVAAQPARLLCLFVGGAPYPHARAVMEACRRDHAWAQLDYAYWCPVIGTVWPAALARELGPYVDAQEWPRTFRSDDEIVGRFIRGIGHRPLATVPSLVEHEDVHESLIGKRALAGADLARVAACYIGDGDPALIDWTAGP